MCQICAKNTIMEVFIMVSYRKRGKVWQYEISYKDIDGTYKKIRKSGFKFKIDAEKAASQVHSYYLDLTDYHAGDMPFYLYFENWLDIYKRHTVSSSTFIKYQGHLTHVKHLFGDLKLNQISRQNYQTALNVFAQNHSIRTVKTFHKQLRSVLLDAIDEQYIFRDPTRKVILHGTKSLPKVNALNYSEWTHLINNLDTTNLLDTIIYISAVTGLRYAEVLGLTLSDIDKVYCTLNINKTWDYKYHNTFKSTKNDSSIRKIKIDNKTLQVLLSFAKNKSISEPIFVQQNKALVSSEINTHLSTKLKVLQLPRITFHGLRHTHASILLFQGVSILSVSKRLGHSSVTTTQSTYLHVIKELELSDNDKIINILSQI